MPTVGSFILFCDNMYGSFDLANFCSTFGFGYVFTMRQSRLIWFWDWVYSLMKPSPVGDWISLKSRDGIYITIWQDNGKNPTNFVSNIQCNAFKETVRKFKGGKRKSLFQKLVLFIILVWVLSIHSVKHSQHHWKLNIITGGRGKGKG